MNWRLNAPRCLRYQRVNYLHSLPPEWFPPLGYYGQILVRNPKSNLGFVRYLPISAYPPGVEDKS